jgi:hypothetical protein
MRLPLLQWLATRLLAMCVLVTHGWEAIGIRPVRAITGAPVIGPDRRMRMPIGQVLATTGIGTIRATGVAKLVCPRPRCASGGSCRMAATQSGIEMELAAVPLGVRKHAPQRLETDAADFRTRNRYRG